MILAYRGLGWISRRIKAVTRGPYSHIAWQMADGRVIEAWGTGGGFVRFLAQGRGPMGEIRRVADASAQHTPETLVDVFTFQGLEEVRGRVEAFLESELGQPYDYRGVLGFKTGAQTSDAQAWFCSELVAEACRRAGVELHRRVESHLIDPTWLTRSAILTHAFSFITRASL